MSAWQALRAAYRAQVARRPTLFYGVPFVTTIVLGSFALAQLTQIRYAQHSERHRAVSQEEQLRLKHDRKRPDIREEYFKLMAKGDQLGDWEPKRVERPAGMPEWGGMPQAPPPGKEAVDADLAPNSASSFFARRAVHAEERAPGDEDTHAPPPPHARKPAVVLGPDGKPCRACNARVAFGAALRAQPRTARAAPPRDACPPDVEELGRSTWTFLHSAAAYFPDAPSDEQKHAMQAMLDALPLVYPCATCAEELREEYARQPPTARVDAVESATTLQAYVCTLHNEVNARLGKPLWDCADRARLRHRWYEPEDEAACV